MNRIGLLLACILLASVGLAQRQDNVVLSNYRILAKPGKQTELKKALAAHAAKFHKGDQKWRVFEVVSGKDEGCYQINEGPASWSSLEERKNISDEHDRDYDATVLPLVEKSLPTSYMRYQSEYSTDQYQSKFKKVLLRHFYMKPGKGLQFANDLPMWKKAFEKAGRSVTVWASAFSGQPHVDVAMRLPGGWSDLDHFGSQDIQNAFDAVGGRGTYAKMMDNISQCVDRIDEDMMELLPEVGSPEVTSK